MDLCPRPLCYVEQGAPLPAWLPRSAPPFGLLHGKGPDGNGGTCYNGPYRDGDWRRHRSGWWLLAEGHRPQHMLRPVPHPRVVKWHSVQGATAEDFWQVPELIHPATGGGWASSLDRVWSDGGWRDPDDLESIASMLLAVSSDAPIAKTADERNASIARMVVAAFALGHYFDIELADMTGWLTESVQARAVMAMAGMPGC